MMPPSESPYELEVSRASLAQALKMVARLIGKRAGDASLRFENGSLSVEAANTAADVPARGTWPLPIFAHASWVRQLARRMPADDPIRLRVEAGRLYASRYSQACSWTATERLPDCTPDSWSPEHVEASLIQEAALILRPLRIEKPAVESLVSEALAKGTCSWAKGFVAWSEEEKKMRKIVEKAWMKLAPFGVGMPDIHRLVDETIRDAWKANREK
jgi:hypothetical protein